jgi:hypothetical protein
MISRQSAVLVAAAMPLGGCVDGGAPSLPFFGAYFPAWMLAAMIGTAVAVLAKLVIVAAGLQAAMPWQLAVCSSLGLIAAVAVGLLAFG